MAAAASVWNLVSSVMDAIREHTEFKQMLKRRQDMAEKLASASDFQQCASAAGALDVTERQFSLLNHYSELLKEEPTLHDIRQDGSATAVANQLASKELCDKLKVLCRSAVNLCLRALAGNAAVWKIIGPAMGGTEYAAELERQSIMGPITDFAVSTNARQWC